MSEASLFKTLSLVIPFVPKIILVVCKFRWSGVNQDRNIRVSVSINLAYLKSDIYSPAHSSWNSFSPSLWRFLVLQVLEIVKQKKTANTSFTDVFGNRLTSSNRIEGLYFPDNVVLRLNLDSDPHCFYVHIGCAVMSLKRRHWREPRTIIQYRS